MKKRNIRAANLVIFGVPALAIWLFFILEFAGAEFWIFDGGESTIMYLTFAVIGSIVCTFLFFFYSSKQIRLQKHGVVTCGTLTNVGGISKYGQTPCDISYEHEGENFTKRFDVSNDEIAALQNGSKWMMVFDPENPSKTASYIDLYYDRETNVTP